MARFNGLLFSVLIFACLFAVLPARAQMEDPTTQQGLKPYVAYHGGDFDAVSLMNGKLDLHIPLVSWPQRGNLKLGFTIRYDNPRLTEDRDAPGTCGTPGNPCTYWSTFDGGGVYVSPDFASSIYTQPLYDLSTFIGNVYAVTDSSGANHTLGLTSGSTYETRDATGYSWNSTTNVITDRDGVRHYPGSCNTPGYLSGNIAKLEDTNGNQITCNSGVFTDTIGRAISLVQTTTTDYSGCTGQLPISSASVWTVPGPIGGSVTFKFCYVRVTLNVMLETGLNHYADTTTHTMLQSIVLPNGTAWTFDYANGTQGPTTPSGSLVKITMPTGGTISYTSLKTHTCGSNSTFPHNYEYSIGSRTIDPHDGSTPAPWSYIGGVTDPLGNQTIHTFTALGTSCSLYETQAQYYQGPASANVLLKTVTTDYSWLQTTNMNNGGYSIDNVVPIRITTTIPVGSGTKVTKVEKDYDSGFTFTDVRGTQWHGIYGNVVTEREYDYGSGVPGALLRRTSTNYQAFVNASYLTYNILGSVYSVADYDSTANTCKGVATYCAYSYFGYDESALASSGITTQVNASPLNGTIRGNQTSAHRWLNTNSTYLNTTRTYFDTGMAKTSTDPGGHTTTFAYSSTFAGAYPTQTTLPDTNSPNLAHHVASTNYDFNTGVALSRTDENSQITSYSYDNMSRIHTVTPPSAGGVTTYTYIDTPGSLNVEKQTQIDTTGRLTDEFVYFDGLGRQTSQSVYNDESTPWDKSDTCYDANGRKSFTSYPYQANSPTAARICSGAGDAISYDALSRTTSVTHSDGTSVTTLYTGAATRVTDEGNGTVQTQKVSQVDGLGRLVSVCEVTSATLVGITPTPAACNQDIAATGFYTSYQYDSLGNLTGVTQGGLNPRTFVYDSVSRLVTDTNPETGTTTNSYDPDGNVLQRVRPKPNQSNASVTVTTTKAYDPLHRITSKTYSDTTPPVTFNYDETAAFGKTLTNTTGRKSSEYTGASASKTTGEVYSFDNVARVVDNSQCTPQNCATGTFSITYTYDLLGDAVALNSTATNTFTYTFNRAARLTSVTSSISDANHPGTLLSAVHYNVFGSAASDTLGNGIAETYAFTARGWVQSLSAVKSSTSVYSFSIINPANSQTGYSGNGNVLYANDSVNGNWAYTYDPMNRLITSGKSGQAFSYVYDRFGNRWQQNVTAGSGPNPSYSFDANNRVIGSSMTYDAAGNITSDGSHTYTYDAENRIASVDSGATTFVYNADGLRVKKLSSQWNAEYVHDLAGRAFLDMAPGAGWAMSEIYAGGRHLGTYRNSTTYFNLNDWLGTERVRTNMAGQVCESMISLAYGDAQTTSGSCGDPSPLHFTGQMRDTETGLDEFPARYYSSTQGRWYSPDWSLVPVAIPYADLLDPRTLNLYDYVGDDPTNHPDADGHFQAPGQESSNACQTNNQCAENQQIQVQQKAQNTTAAAVVAAPTTAEEINAVVKPLVESAVGALEKAGTSALEAAGGVVLFIFASSQKTASEEQDTIHRDFSGKKDSAEPEPAAASGGKGVRGGKKDRSPDGTVDQLNSIQKNQATFRQRGQGERIRSTKKSEQNVDNTNRRIKSLEDVENQ